MQRLRKNPFDDFINKPKFQNSFTVLRYQTIETEVGYLASALKHFIEQ